MLQYITNADHYNLVLSRVAAVKQTLWIGTADIKDLHVKSGNDTIPFLECWRNPFANVWR